MTPETFAQLTRTSTPTRLPGLPDQLLDDTNATAARTISLRYGPRGGDEIPAGTRVRAELDGEIARLEWRGWPTVVGADALEVDVRDGA